MSTKITSLPNGNVQVNQSYFDGSEESTLVREFTEIGAYVHQVFPNGSTSQICEGLQVRGPTLMAGGDLAKVIRRTLG